MRFGVNIPNFGPDCTPSALREWAHRVEGTGFHVLMVSDHVALTQDVRSLFPAPFFDSLTTLTWLAGLTERVELGTTVLVLPYRHPLQTARSTASLDQFSGGRFIFGLAGGWAPQEFAALNLPYAERGPLTDDHLEAILRLWTHDSTSFQGRYTRFPTVHTAPRPVRRPHPPIWVGGHSRAALRRAVQYGDAWHPTSLPMAALRTGTAMLRQVADRMGRPVPALAPRIKLRLTDAPLPEGGRLAGEGTVEQLHRDLTEMAGMGVEYVVLDPTYPGVPNHHEHQWKALEVVAESVVDLDRQTLR